MAEKSRINTIGIHHVSINVKDVDTALTFYIELLNLELLERPDLGFPGAWIRAGEQEIHLLGIDSGEPVKEQHFNQYKTIGAMAYVHKCGRYRIARGSGF